MSKLGEAFNPGDLALVRDAIKKHGGKEELPGVAGTGELIVNFNDENSAKAFAAEVSSQDPTIERRGSKWKVFLFFAHEESVVAKASISEAIKRNGDIKLEHIRHFDAHAPAEQKAEYTKAYAENRFEDALRVIREFLIREVVRRKLAEVIKKKPGGGYVLYSPAKGKKKGKPAGTYPTAAAAKKAQFNKFPPKDPEAKKRAKDAIAKADKKKPAAKKESLEIMALRVAVRKMMVESLFREEKAGSEWDDYVSRLPKQIFSNDKKLANLQKGIEKRVEGALEDALAHIAKAVGKKVKIKSHGIKKNESGKTYISFGATVDEVSVDPIYVYIQSGVPKLEVSDNARASLTKIEPQTSKLFRADLVQVQERVLDHMDELARAIEARDKYLMKIEAEVDKYVADLSGLELTLLKRLLTQKYRKN